MTNNTSALYGCEGPQLTDWERGFFSEQRPWGYILFGRNIADPQQLRRLTDSLRAASDDPDALIFVDQEGGSVARLRGPHFRHPPAPRKFADLARSDPELAAEAMWLNARLMAAELKAVGINANCSPMVDVVQPDAHPFLATRALGDDPDTVIALGRAMALGLRDGGVSTCIKHAPGHGRGKADSHHDLPNVPTMLAELSECDFKPFRALRKEPMLMSAHVLYTDIDPDLPGTLSPDVITGIVRDVIGFEGLILTDDINMNALPGSIEERSRLALEAGCEIICHCNGEKDDMVSVARAAIPVEGLSKERGDRARALAWKDAKPFEQEAAVERLKSLGLYEDAP